MPYKSTNRVVFREVNGRWVRWRLGETPEAAESLAAKMNLTETPPNAGLEPQPQPALSRFHRDRTHWRKGGLGHA